MKFNLSIILFIPLICSASNCGINSLSYTAQQLIEQHSKISNEKNNWLRSLGPMAGTMEMLNGPGSSTFMYDSRLKVIEDDMRSTHQMLKNAIELKRLGACK